MANLETLILDPDTGTIPYNDTKNKAQSDRLSATVLQDILAYALGIVAPAVGGRTSLPVLEHVLVQSDGGRIKITACNLEQAITVWIGAKVETDGAIALPFKTFRDVVSSLNVDVMKIDVSGTLKAKLTCRRTTANVNGLDAPEFPDVPEFDAERGIVSSILASDFKKALARVVFAAAIDEARPMLTGVQMKFEGKVLQMNATDGFRLSRVSLDLAEPVAENVTILVPSSIMRSLMKVLPADNGEMLDIQITARGHSVIFHSKDISISAQLLDQKFPEVDNIIPKKFGTKVIAVRADLLKVCKQVSVFSRESLDTMKFVIRPSLIDGEPGMIEVSARADETGDSTSSVEAVITGGEIPIAFNAKYMVEMLSALDSPQIAIELTASRSAAVIRMVGDDSFLHVIMPMNLPR